MSDTQVTIYGAEWCPPCHALKDYLKSRKVEYKYINIDEDRDAAREVSERTGWTAIPIVKIADEYILGFERHQIDGALSAAKLI